MNAKISNSRFQTLLSIVSIAIVLILFPDFTATAKQTEKWYSVPAGYIEGMGSLEIPKNAPCEKGKESFSSFLENFNGSEDFRNERIRVTESHEPSIPYSGLLELYMKAFDQAGLFPISGHLVKNMEETEFDDYTEAGIFYNIKKNEVTYNCWKFDDPEGYSSCGAVIMFERIDGKWYLTDLFSVGSLNTMVSKLME